MSLDVMVFESCPKQSAFKLIQSKQGSSVWVYCLEMKPSEQLWWFPQYYPIHPPNHTTPDDTLEVTTLYEYHTLVAAVLFVCTFHDILCYTVP